MSKMSFDISAWIQHPPSFVLSPYEKERKGAGSDALTNLTPANENFRLIKLRCGMVNFSISKRTMVYLYIASILFLAAFTALLIFFFKNFNGSFF